MFIFSRFRFPPGFVTYLSFRNHLFHISIRPPSLLVSRWTFRHSTHLFSTFEPSLLHQFCCCCCLPTHPCLFGGVLPYFEMTGHPVPVSSLGFKCPDCFIWICSYIVYPSKMKGSFNDNSCIICVHSIYTNQQKRCTF